MPNVTAFDRLLSPDGKLLTLKGQQVWVAHLDSGRSVKIVPRQQGDQFFAVDGGGLKSGLCQTADDAVLAFLLGLENPLLLWQAESYRLSPNLKLEENGEEVLVHGVLSPRWIEPKPNSYRGWLRRGFNAKYAIEWRDCTGTVSGINVPRPEIVWADTLKDAVEYAALTRQEHILAIEEASKKSLMVFTSHLDYSQPDPGRLASVNEEYEPCAGGYTVIATRGLWQNSDGSPRYMGQDWR